MEMISYCPSRMWLRLHVGGPHDKQPDNKD